MMAVMAPKDSSWRCEVDRPLRRLHVEEKIELGINPQVVHEVPLGTFELNMTADSPHARIHLILSGVADGEEMRVHGGTVRFESK